MKLYERTLPKLNEKYRYVKHPSGLEIYFLPKDFPDYFISIAAKFGSFIRTLAGEPIPDGTAHYLEHLLFRMPDGSDASDAFSEMGAYVNAWTTNEYTMYFSTGTEHKYRVLELLLRMVTEPSFTREAVEHERDIITQELNIYADQPANALYLATMEALYREHPIRIDVGGTPATIQAIDDALLHRLYEAYYRPSNLVMVVGGKFQAKRVLGIVDRILGCKPYAPTPLTLPNGEPMPECTVHRQITADVVTDHLMLAFRDPVILSGADQSKRGYTADIACRLIFGKAGELYHALYEGELCHRNLSALYEWADGCGHILIKTKSDRTADAIRYLTDYLLHIRDHMPSEERFLRERNNIYADTIRMFDSLEDICISFMEETIGDCDLFDLPERILSITYSDFCRFINEVIAKNPTAIIEMHPNEKKAKESL